MWNMQYVLSAVNLMEMLKLNLKDQFLQQWNSDRPSMLVLQFLWRLWWNLIEQRETFERELRLEAMIRDLRLWFHHNSTDECILLRRLFHCFITSLCWEKFATGMQGTHRHKSRLPGIYLMNAFSQIQDLSNTFKSSPSENGISRTKSSAISWK